MDIRFFKENLKKKLKEQKITLSALAIQADLSEDTLRSIIYGKSQDIKLSSMVKIADVLNCTLDNLIGRSIYSPDKQDFIDRMQKLPNHSFHTLQTVLSIEENLVIKQSNTVKKSISLLTPFGIMKDGQYYSNGYYEAYDITDYPKEIKDNVDFGLRITTDYFEPVYYLNDVLLISRQKTPQYYDIVLYLDSNEKMYIRQYLETGLYPINHYGNNIPIEKINNFKVLGVILMVAQEFDIEQYR